MRPRQEIDIKLWHSITTLDYDDVMCKRNMYYSGVRNDETRKACSVYQFYRARLKDGDRT